MARRPAHDKNDRVNTDNESGYVSVEGCPDFHAEDMKSHGVAGDPLGESAVLVAIQDTLFDVPGVVPAARAMSLFGEHALGWMGLGAAGAVMIDKKNSRGWWTVTGSAFVAHAAAVVLKRIVRRPRPHRDDITIGVSTPSKLSFPSSHATSTTAALVAVSHVTGSRLPLVGIPLMMMSRMVLGVHYPTDVTAGAVLGWGTAAALAKATKR